jgi:hypothetical protein
MSKGIGDRFYHTSKVATSSFKSDHINHSAIEVKSPLLTKWPQLG